MVSVNATMLIGYMAAVLFGIMAYYARTTLSNMEEHGAAALAMFFLQSDAVRAVEYHAIGALVLAVSVAITAISFATDMAALRLISRPATVISLLGVIYFYRTTAKITGKPGNVSTTN